MNQPTLEEKLAKLESELNALRSTQASQTKLRRRVGFAVMLSFVLGSGLAMAVGTFTSNAAVPATIPYEGYLEIGGAAVDGTRNMRFELLHCTSSDVSTCQSDAVWDSGSVPVSVSAGRFATLLGDDTYDADAYTSAGHGLFVRISVDATGDNTELTQLGQLQQIHSVPFAANAVVASKAIDFDVSGNLTVDNASITGAASINELSASKVVLSGPLAGLHLQGDYEQRTNTNSAQYEGGEFVAEAYCQEGYWAINGGCSMTGINPRLTMSYPIHKWAKVDPDCVENDDNDFYCEERRSYPHGWKCVGQGDSGVNANGVYAKVNCLPFE